MKHGTFSVARSEIDDKAAKSRARHAKPQNKLYIDGGYYSIGEVAKKIGLNASATGARIRQLRNASGPITFQRLKDLGQ